MRALVIDDHPLINEVLPAVLRKALGDDVEVATEVQLEAGILRAGAEQPDLVLLDLGLPGCKGLDALSRFRAHFPQMRIVVVSATCDRDSILEALDAGVAGYLPKTSKPDVMVAALKLIAAGGAYIPSEVLEEPRARHRDGLTDRQRDVLRLMQKGYSNQKIGAELSIAPNTVKQHAHAIFAALGVSTRAQAAIAAARRGLTLG